jgi:hypothetical protein
LSKLHIKNDIGGSGGYLKVTDAGYAGDVRFGMADGIDNDAHFGTWTNNNILAFTNGSEAMRIDSSGRVGINEDNPETSLHVEGTIQLGNEEDLAWAYDNGNYYNYIKNFYNTTDGLVYRSGSWTGTQTVVAHSFETWTGSAWDKKMVIKQNGFVGIGTQSPLLNLQINSDTDANSTIAYSENDTLKWYTRHNASNDSFQIVDVPNTTTVLHIASGGDVGINKTPEGFSQLEVKADTNGKGALLLDSNATTQPAFTHYEVGGSAGS